MKEILFMSYLRYLQNCIKNDKIVIYNGYNLIRHFKINLSKDIKVVCRINDKSFKKETEGWNLKYYKLRKNIPYECLKNNKNSMI